jgi:hypothetical protein
MQSCEKMEYHYKQQEPLTSNESVTPKMYVNADYIYYLTKIDSPKYEITIQPEHGLISELAVDKNGKAIYKYRPQHDYYGEDSVVLTTRGLQEKGVTDPSVRAASHTIITTIHMFMDTVAIVEHP